MSAAARPVDCETDNFEATLVSDGLLPRDGGTTDDRPRRGGNERIKKCRSFEIERSDRTVVRPSVLSGDGVADFHQFHSPFPTATTAAAVSQRFGDSRSVGRSHR